MKKKIVVSVLYFSFIFTFYGCGERIEMIKIKGGTFQMGCTEEQNNCNNDEKPVHKVRVDGFKISKYEITNRQYVNFLNEKQ